LRADKQQERVVDVTTYFTFKRSASIRHIKKQAEGTHTMRSSSFASKLLLVSLVSDLLLDLTTMTSAFEATPLPPIPLSTREALIQKSKLVNPPEGYATPGWSNRAGTLLTPVHLDPGVYTGDRPFYWNDIDVSCRMTVVELPSSSREGKPDLWVQSPVNLDGPMIEALTKLGTVRHVVSPNYEHLKFASAWYQNYGTAEKDAAKMWGCPGLAAKLPQIAWQGEIPQGYRPPGWKGGDGTFVADDLKEELWDLNVLQALHVDIEKNPFTGKPFFNEVIFYHAPSKTLITTGTSGVNTAPLSF
jgi:hypothetical protein